MSCHYTHETTPQLQLQLQLQLQVHYTNYTTLQLQLHYATTTTTAALQHAKSSSCGWGDHCNHCKHSKQHSSNHLSVHQWIRPGIHASQQLTSPIVSYTWNFRHCLAWYYWQRMNTCNNIQLMIFIMICNRKNHQSISNIFELSTTTMALVFMIVLMI